MSYRTELLTATEFVVEELERDIFKLILERTQVNELRKLISNTESTDSDVLALLESHRVLNKSTREETIRKKLQSSFTLEDVPKGFTRDYIPNKESYRRITKSYLNALKATRRKKVTDSVLESKAHISYEAIHRPLIKIARSYV